MIGPAEVRKRVLLGTVSDASAAMLMAFAADRVAQDLVTTSTAAASADPVEWNSWDYWRDRLDELRLLYGSGSGSPIGVIGMDLGQGDVGLEIQVQMTDRGFRVV